MQSLSGQDFDHYTLAETIHEGVETAVVRAYRNESRTSVIIKLLTSEYPTPRSIARLRHEHAIMSRVQCEGIARVYGLETYRRGLALILEDLGDESLSSMLRSQRLDLRTSLQIAISVAATLAVIHQHNIIHRDIKPRNLMMDPAARHPKLIDFGIATYLSRGTQRAMAPDSLEGTLAYIAPEQTGRMNRAVDHRTDLYSFGVTLYEMLTGALPFATNDPMELVYSHIARPPLPPCERSPDVPRAVSDLVMRLLAKAAEDRYQSARGLKADLEECLSRVEADGHIDLFPLGRHDSAGELRLPQKLYGRDRDVDALLAAHERTHEGAVELLLVRGPAGIGKSALVNEIHKSIARGGGYFITGKFDQLSRNIPYAPMTHAFEELIRQILTEPEEALSRWREKVKGVVGTNGQLLVDLIPALGHLLGPQPSVQPLGPSESENRFTLLFQNFHLCGRVTGSADCVRPDAHLVCCLEAVFREKT